MDPRIEQIAKGSPDAQQFIEPELSDLGAQYVQDDKNFISRLMAPAVPVAIQGGKFWEYSKADFNRDEMEVRGDGAPAAEGGYTRAEKQYFCDVFALAKRVGPQERTNNPRADRNATRYLARKGLIKAEKHFGSIAWKTGVWTTEFTGKTSPGSATEFLKWADASATPIETLEEIIEAYEGKAAGFPIKKLAFGRKAWRRFKTHPNVINYFNRGQTSGGVKVTREMVAAILEIDEVFVAKAVETTSAKNVTPETYARILDEDAVLGVYTPDSPSQDEPSALYHFDWTGYTNSTPNGVAVFEEVVPLSGGARLYTLEHAFQSKLVAADMGFWLQKPVAGQ